jgi:SagB-type dehydrogenase family enzyme
MLVRKRRVLIYMAALLIASLLPLNNGSPANHALAVEDALEVLLPPPVLDGGVSLEQALTLRRSTRSFADTPLAFDDVAQLLWAAQGITETRRGFRTAPSAGALFPLEAYVVAGNVEGLDPGVYRYLPREHTLLPVKAGDMRNALYNNALRQGPVRTASAVFCLSAVYQRTSKKYGERAERYVHMEIGHAGQNICLQAAALNLGVVTIGAFHDKDAAAVLGLPAEEDLLYILPVGHKVE